METGNNQDLENGGILTPKQFRTKFQEIFEAETNFGSARAARLELLESVADIIKGYLNHDCAIVYLYGKLKEAGYTGSRKELSEWLVEKGLWTKREVSEKKAEVENPKEVENSVNAPSNTGISEKKEEEAGPPDSTKDIQNNVPPPPTFAPGPRSKPPTIEIGHQHSTTNNTQTGEQK